MISSTYQVSGAGPTLTGRNGGGDPYYTDGEITTAVIEPALDPAAQKPPPSAIEIPQASPSRE